MKPRSRSRKSRAKRTGIRGEHGEPQWRVERPGPSTISGGGQPFLSDRCGPHEHRIEKTVAKCEASRVEEGAVGEHESGWGTLNGVTPVVDLEQGVCAAALDCRCRNPPRRGAQDGTADDQRITARTWIE